MAWFLQVMWQQGMGRPAYGLVLAGNVATMDDSLAAGGGSVDAA